MNVTVVSGSRLAAMHQRTNLQRRREQLARQIHANRLAAFEILEVNRLQLLLIE